MLELVLVYVIRLASTYTCVELVWSFACCSLGHNIGGATRSSILRSKTGRFAHVPSPSATRRELVEGGTLALSTFARDCSVDVDGVVATDVTGAYAGSVPGLL